MGTSHPNFDPELELQSAAELLQQFQQVQLQDPPQEEPRQMANPHVPPAFGFQLPFKVVAFEFDVETLKWVADCTNVPGYCADRYLNALGNPFEALNRLSMTALGLIKDFQEELAKGILETSGVENMVWHVVAIQAPAEPVKEGKERWVVVFGIVDPEKELANLRKE